MQDLWDGIREGLRRAVFGVERRAEVVFAEATAAIVDDRVQVSIVLGDWPSPRIARAVLGDGFGLARLRRIVEFAGRRGLPVDDWVIHGAEAVPMRTDELARWLSALTRLARRGRIVVVDDGMSAATRQRLVAHLRRLDSSPRFAKAGG